MSNQTIATPSKLDKSIIIINDDTNVLSPPSTLRPVVRNSSKKRKKITSVQYHKNKKAKLQSNSSNSNESKPDANKHLWIF